MHELEHLISKALDYKKKKILGLLKLRRAVEKRPSIFRSNFKIAAQDALKKQARKRFYSLVGKNEYARITFPSGWKSSRKEEKFNSKLERIRKKGVKRLIYVHWAYFEGKRIPVYVGQTKGRGGRAAHPEFHKECNVTKIQLYRVKEGKRKLDAAECLGIHAFAPLGERYPLLNKMKAKRSRRAYRCRICIHIRNAWKIVEALKK